MSTPTSDRQQRLAEALRANLRRRKGQARAGASEAAPDANKAAPPRAQDRAD